MASSIETDISNISNEHMLRWSIISRVANMIKNAGHNISSKRYRYHPLDTGPVHHIHAVIVMIQNHLLNVVHSCFVEASSGSSGAATTDWAFGTSSPHLDRLLRWCISAMLI